jgi:hypothetical protein
VSNDPDNLIRALRSMPTPEPRPEFIDRALAKATRRHATGQDRSRLHQLAASWQTWVGAGLGGMIAAALTVVMLRPATQPLPAENEISLALNETREIDVIIDSERDLHNATIHIALAGGIALEGFENEQQIDWQTNLERGTNVLSLPIFARGAGTGRLIAVVEHDGRRRTITIDLTVRDNGASRS